MSTCHHHTVISKFPLTHYTVTSHCTLSVALYSQQLGHTITNFLVSSTIQSHPLHALTIGSHHSVGSLANSLQSVTVNCTLSPKLFSQTLVHTQQYLTITAHGCVSAASVGRSPTRRSPLWSSQHGFTKYRVIFSLYYFPAIANTAVH